MDKRIHALSTQLSSLRAGERSWFWFSPDAPEVPLLMTPFADPKGMAKVLRRGSQIPLPAGARVCTGICVATELGALQFGGNLFNEMMVGQFATWVRRYVDEYPGLAHLSGSTMVRLSEGGRVEGRFDRPEMWSGIQRPLMPGSLAEAEAGLAGLAAGQERWLWLSEESRGEAPLVESVCIEADPQGKQFAERVVNGRLRSLHRGAGVRGTARRMASGALVITTADSLDGVGAKSSAWLAGLGSVRLVQIKGGKLTATRQLGGGQADCAAQVAALKAMRGGETQMFWFTHRSKDGGPLLLLAGASAALKGAVHKAATDAKAIRGRARAVKWGVAFQSRSADPAFLSKLADWVGQHHARWPGLRALVGARLSVVDAAGKNVERFRDDNVWSSLRKLEN